MTMDIPLDILLCIVEHLDHDIRSLFRCSLANRCFNLAASKFLYQRVKIAPSHPSIPIVSDDRRKQERNMRRMMISACLSHNAPHVVIVEVTGYLTRVDDIQLLHTWNNLQVVILLPQWHDCSIHMELIPHLIQISTLQRLTVNALLCDESQASILTSIENLESLTVWDPTRAILQLLPDWLHRLSPTLKELHLENNCGSVTPGVLRALAVSARQLRSLTLGLSYSLTNDDVFSFLEQISELSEFKYRYYPQSRIPTHSPFLPHLHTLVVHYAQATTTTEVNNLCKWVRLAAARAPLAVLRLVCEDHMPGSSINYGALAEHLMHTHAETLCVLSMSEAYIKPGALRRLCARCTNLQDLCVTSSASVLITSSGVFTMLPRLHTLNIKTQKVKGKVVVNGPEFFGSGLTNLRRLTVNENRWEGRWVLTAQGDVQFLVFQVNHDQKTRGRV